MIREYLRQIRNIIYNDRMADYGLHNTAWASRNTARASPTGRSAENQTIINKIIGFNDLLLRRLALAKGNNLNMNYSSVYNHQYGSGADEPGPTLDKLIQDMEGINDSLSKMMREEIKIDTQEFINVATDAVEMIKFLGQLIEEGKNVKLTEIQQQIFDIVNQLDKYLK
jgi:hypothetical protein